MAVKQVTVFAMSLRNHVRTFNVGESEPYKEKQGRLRACKVSRREGSGKESLNRKSTKLRSPYPEGKPRSALYRETLRAKNPLMWTPISKYYRISNNFG